MIDTKRLLRSLLKTFYFVILFCVFCVSIVYMITNLSPMSLIILSSWGCFLFLWYIFYRIE